MSVYDYSAQRLDGHEEKLSAYRGQILLIVNTASQCGFTPQYAGLESLYTKLHAGGLTVLGFPCNQFGAQEPGPEAEIGAFCEKTYDVTFHLFAKVEVNGSHAHPLYRFLKEQKPGFLGIRRIHWNFAKFLVDGKGSVVARYRPSTKPQDMAAAIEALLDTP